MKLRWCRASPIRAIIAGDRDIISPLKWHMHNRFDEQTMDMAYKINQDFALDGRR